MTTVNLSHEAVFQLHPTAILTDGALMIKAFGPLAVRFAPGARAGRPLTQFFDVPSGLKPSALGDFCARQSQISLVAKDRSIPLTATLLASQGDYLLVMRPVIDPVGRLAEGLQMADFPAEDPLVQCLLQIFLLQALRDETEKNTRDLRQAWEENDEILTQLRRITGFMSHEFSNLLSIIQLNCERIASPDLPETDKVRAITMIRETAQRGGNVARWLQALSGDADLSYREPLDDFLRFNLPLLKTLCGPEVAISALLGAGTASVDAPACSLLSCIVKIVRVATQAGGPAIAVKLETRPASVSAKGVPIAEVRIAVEAEHPIDGERLLSRRLRSFVGHETGSSSVRDFVRSVDGAVHWEAADETRACVSLLLPCEPLSKIAPPRAVGLQAPAAADRGHLVIVEDEPAALEALAELLQFEGYTVSECSDAEQALAALAARPRSVLVTDVVLPGRDGLSLAREAVRGLPQLPVIVMSGHVPDPKHYDPCWTFVQKPLNVDELIAAIQRARQ